MLLTVLLAAAPGAPSLTVVTQGPRATEVRREVETLTLPVEWRFAELPDAVPRDAQPADLVERLAQARKAWVEANFAACLTALGDEALVTDALARFDRAIAARLLLWRTACHVGANQTELARRSADALATFELPVPPDVAGTSPDVELVLGRAFKTVGSGEVVPLQLRGTEGALVAVDGRPAMCNLPCRMDLAPGTHVVVVTADGHRPVSRVVGLMAPAPELDVTLPAADPEVAAQQWVRRSAQGDAADSPTSLELLATALRAPRLLVLTSSNESLRGALVVDGAVTRAERPGDAAGLVRDLLVRGRVVEEAPPLYARWPFWVAVGVAAVGAGVATAVIVANEPVRTAVELHP